jgi:pyruvate kinase
MSCSCCARRVGAVIDVGDLRSVAAEVDELRERLLAAEVASADAIAAAHPAHRRSAANLVHYVELRNHDIRELQTALGLLGVSSLGRAEPYVLATVEAVLTALAGLAGLPPVSSTARIGLDEGLVLLARNADLLLGAAPAQRSTRIMVTLPSEAADDEVLISELISRGMDVARINCAHDDSATWKQMVAFLRSGSSADGRPCRIAMDLGGPKLRTGPLLPGPRVIRVRPKRDELGIVVSPALVWLSPSGQPVPIGDGDGPIDKIPVDDDAWVRRRRCGDVIELDDSRGARRRWAVVEVAESGCLASVDDTTYVMTGLALRCRSAHEDDDCATVGELPEIALAHRVHLGDRVILTRSLEPTQSTEAGADHYIGCSLAEAFDQARSGERVWLDDGKIGGTIESVTRAEIALTVTDVRPGGAKLKAGKGINLPETDLQLDALTPKDLDDLEFVAVHADLVNLSFVRRPQDIEKLQDELRRLGAGEVGIVLKIENAAAFENLPELLLTAMRSRLVGVMIARGDLAVEVGFERLAEVQEEIMWACEAAHVPVIWATQVLDTLARTGQPSRAEVTDAAMSERAECVMLNKGPYIAEAISALDSILTRMNDHQDKKRSLLRRLLAWGHTSQGHQHQ